MLELQKYFYQLSDDFLKLNKNNIYTNDLKTQCRFDDASRVFGNPKHNNCTREPSTSNTIVIIIVMSMFNLI